jgi:hypothetical protein
MCEGMYSGSLKGVMGSQIWFLGLLIMVMVVVEEGSYVWDCKWFRERLSRFQHMCRAGRRQVKILEVYYGLTVNKLQKLKLLLGLRSTIEELNYVNEVITNYKVIKQVVKNGRRDSSVGGKVSHLEEGHRKSNIDFWIEREEGHGILSCISGCDEGSERAVKLDVLNRNTDCVMRLGRRRGQQPIFVKFPLTEIGGAEKY